MQIPLITLTRFELPMPILLPGFCIPGGDSTQMQVRG